MLISLLLQTTTVIILFVTILFLISLLLKRNDIADVAWGPGIALASWSSWYFTDMPQHWHILLVLTLVTLWALRLGIRIGLKNLHKAEDARYRRWRESWGTWFYLRSYLQVFILQGALMVVLASSVMIAMTYAESDFISFVTIIGTCVWVFGFSFEIVGDWQLDAFLKNPANKGELMTSGLWHYSRHPNYFGEITMWWGLWIITLPVPLSYLGLLSPLTITGLILFVSGIPLLEAMMAKHPDWVRYKEKTSVLIPWWPK